MATPPAKSGPLLSPAVGEDYNVLEYKSVLTEMEKSLSSLAKQQGEIRNRLQSLETHLPQIQEEQKRLSEGFQKIEKTQKAIINISMEAINRTIEGENHPFSESTAKIKEIVVLSLERKTS